MSHPDTEPWKMTAAQWHRRMGELAAQWYKQMSESSGNAVQARFTRSSAAKSISLLESLTAMRFDVHGEATKRLNLAAKGQLKLSRKEVDDLRDQLGTPVTHQMVVEKAMREGYPVPEEVLADYPDILQPTPA